MSTGIVPSALLNIVPPAPLQMVDALSDDLLRTRRDIHRNPELAWVEQRTTALVADRLQQGGVAITRMHPTGLVADIGGPGATYRVGLRADIDALPLHERTGLPFASRNPGISHACGHDVHTTALLGAALALHHSDAELNARGIGVRLLFQPAEEAMPGGGILYRDAGVLDDLDAVFALHCDPHRDVGQVGLRRGAITAASDRITVTVRGAGGHTSRPHLTQDLTYAIGKLITELPAALSRRLDPRAAAALVWGSVHAGEAPNVIPDEGEVSGTLRLLDADAWTQAHDLLRELAEQVVAPYGVVLEFEHDRGVPPVVNTGIGVEASRLASRAALGPDSARGTEQSMGGEDFAWMLQGRPGALVRLGTRTPGGVTHDLHRGDLVIDEKAVVLGARLFAALPFAARAVAQEGTVED